MSEPVVATLDIGGTKIAGALVASDGRLLVRTQRPTPARAGSEELSAVLRGVIDELRATRTWPRTQAVGIASTGPVDSHAGTVSPVNIPGWRSYAITRQVGEMAGGLPVVLLGDAVAMAMGEQWLGAARDVDGALCVVVSTGVGGGLVIDGRVYRGPTGNAGHIGHISVELDGDLCVCGARGCVERMASGPSILRTALGLGWTPDRASEATTAGVASAARSGDAAALGAFDRAAKALAAGVAAVASLLDLRLVVIGGGVAEAGDVLFDPLRDHLTEYAKLPFVDRVEVRPAALGRDAGLVGAALAAFVECREHTADRPPANDVLQEGAVPNPAVTSYPGHGASVED
jgi:glucokinase